MGATVSSQAALAGSAPASAIGQGVCGVPASDVSGQRAGFATALIQGPPGPQGKSAYQIAVANGFVGTEQQWLRGLVGPTGSSFGQIRYGEPSNSPPVVVLANMRTQITFKIDPTQTNNFLNPPFEGLALFDGSTIAARALGDLTNIVVNLLVTSLVAGGQIKFDIDVGSPLGPTGTDTAGLFNPAGIPERVTGRLTIQTLSYYLVNGAKIFITSTVPISIVNEALLIMPASVFDGV